MLNPEQIGERGRREPSRSALSGQKLVSGYVEIPIDAARYVRVNGGDWRSLTDAEKQAVRDQWKREVIGVPVEAGAEPDLDAMTATELRAYAAEHDYDVSGRRSADDLRSAIRAAEVAARFATAPDAPEAED